MVIEHMVNNLFEMYMVRCLFRTAGVPLLTYGTQASTKADNDCFCTFKKSVLQTVQS